MIWHTRDRTRQGGFTLIEMLVVLSVLGLALGMIALRNPAVPSSVVLRATAQTFASALREARGIALARNQAESFVLDLDQRRFGPQHGTWHPLPTAVDVLAEVSRSPRGSTVLFYPDGSSSPARFVFLLSDQGIDVVVEWINGRVSVVPHDPG